MSRFLGTQAPTSRWRTTRLAGVLALLLALSGLPAAGAYPRPGVTERVHVASDGTEANGPSTGNHAMSDDGRYVAFTSDASNLVPDDTNDMWDVFVHDRQTGVTERVSVATDGTQANGPSVSPAISADGRYVAFDSNATNLVPGDTNPRDTFVHDRHTGVTERVSVASDAAQANGLSFLPNVSADGRYVAFDSNATNLVPGDTNTWDAFVRDRGPAVGVGGLAVQSATAVVTVAGWASFSGVVVASADDPEDDGEVGARQPGAEIAGASVVYRPELEDLLLRLRLASLPEGGHPGVVYRWRFTVEDRDYEVRALTPAATAAPPTTEPYFGLYACETVCQEVAPLSGGIGTTGAEVRVSLPLEVVGVDAGATLAGVEASTAVGEATPGAVVVLDEVELLEALVPVPRVDLGVAPASTPEEEVELFAEADLVEGRFAGTLDVSALAGGEYRVWARACLGEVCGAHSVPVTVPGEESV